MFSLSKAMASSISAAAADVTSNADGPLASALQEEPAETPMSAEDVQKYMLVKSDLLEQDADAARSGMSKCLELARRTSQISAYRNEVRDWAKYSCATTNPEPFQRLLRGIQEDYQMQADFVIQLSNFRQLLDDFDVQAATLFKSIREQYFVRKRLDRWNPENFAHQLNNLDSIGKDIDTEYNALEQLIRRYDQQSSLSSIITEVDETLRANDSYKIIEQNLKEIQNIQELEDKQDSQIVDLQTKVELAKVSVCNNEERLQLVQTHRDAVQNRVTQLKQRETFLTNQQETTLEDHRRILKQLSDDVENQKKQIRQEMTDAVNQQRASLAASTQKVESVLLDLNQQLLNTSLSPGIHTIFALDFSGSMSGTRCTCLLDAVKSFHTVSLQLGHHSHKVSVISFNHQAERLLSCADISTDVADILLQKKPSGGTAYLPAWKEIQACASLTQTNAKVYVVFVTDGDAGDIAAASGVAAELNTSRAKAGGLTTIVINVDKAVSKDFLKPLVEAGNGGRDRTSVGGQAVELLFNVSAVDMVDKFRVLANLVHGEREEIKSRISLVHEQERQARSSMKEALAAEELVCADRMRSIQTLKLASARDIDDDGQEALFKAQLELIQNMIAAELVSLDNAQHRCFTFNEELAKSRTILQGLERQLEVKIVEHARQKEIFSKAKESKFKDTEDSLEQSCNFVKQGNSTDVATIQQRIQGLRRFHGVHELYRILMNEAKCSVRSIRRFRDSVMAQIRNPLPDINGAIQDVPAFVFKMLLEERGLLQQPGVSAWRQFLEHEVAQVETDDQDEIIRTIMQSVTESEICSGCRLEKDVDAQRNMVVQKVKLYILGQAGFKKTETPESLKKARDELKGTLASIQKKESKLQVELDAECDVDRIEKLGAEIEQVQADIERLEQDLETKNDRLQNLEFVLRSAVPLCRQVERAFDRCTEAYSKSGEQLRLQALEPVFNEVFHTVIIPIRQFREFVHCQTNALAGGTPPGQSITRHNGYVC